MTPQMPILAALAATALIMGCKEEENRTVDYYSSNPEERAEILATCEVSDRALEEANCVNADLAEQQAKRDQDREGFQRTFGDPSFD